MKIANAVLFTDRREQVVQLLPLVHDAHLAQKLGAERPVVATLDRHDRLAEQIAAHHRGSGAVERRRPEELPPQQVGAVDVGCVEQPNGCDIAVASRAA
jgi:hypothetical protein